MQNVENSCNDGKPTHGNFGLVIVIVLYILLAIILSSSITY